MGGTRGTQVSPDYFAASASDEDSLRSYTLDSANLDLPRCTPSHAYSRSNTDTRARKKLNTPLLLLKTLTRALSLRLGEKDEDKVVITSAEVKTLRSELTALEQRESHCKAQIEHVNGILQTARLSGYLFLRMRWARFPGEPLPVDDWIPRFFVMTESCIYMYTKATDISPQDSTLLSDVIEFGRLPSIRREDDETLHCFYILTRYGLRFECSSAFQIQVNSWIEALQTR